MPDPTWTLQYNYANTPESNFFTRTLYNIPTINEVRSGSNRRVEIDSTNGDAVFTSSIVPSLDSDVGATAEFMVNVSGNVNGDAGIELTFLDRAILVQVYPNHVYVGLTGDLETLEYTIPTASNNSDLLYRITYSGSGDNIINVYRGGTLIGGPYNPPVADKTFQRVLWWCEGGAISTWKGMKYYLGGPVVPG